MFLLVEIGVIVAVLAVPLALLDACLTLRARQLRRDAVDEAVSGLLAGATYARDGAGTRTGRR